MQALETPQAAATRPTDRGLPGGSGPARRSRSARQVTAWAFLAPLVVYLLLFYVYPLYRNVDLSLRFYTVRSFIQGGAQFAGLANYGTVFADPMQADDGGPIYYQQQVLATVSRSALGL